MHITLGEASVSGKPADEELTQCPELVATKQMLVTEARSLPLPAGALDELIDGLGGERCVAEMTGRQGRVLRESVTHKGVTIDRFIYRGRAESLSAQMNNLNLTEKQVLISSIDSFGRVDCLRSFSWTIRSKLPSSVMLPPLASLSMPRERQRTKGDVST